MAPLMGRRRFGQSTRRPTALSSTWKGFLQPTHTPLLTAFGSCAETSIPERETTCHLILHLSSRIRRDHNAPRWAWAREIALGFAANGYAVFGTAVRREIRNWGGVSAGQVRLTICAMTQGSALVHLFDRAVSDALRLCRLDLLINNAGT